MTMEDLITQASKKCEIFANPLRNFIATFIAVKEEVTWSELKDALEKWAGGVNPNTLSFHLGELMNAGFITKVDIRGQPRYRIVNDKLSEIKKRVGEELLKAVKENT
ncbi:ArsR family transcriptional regulator [Candidatus Bathyarchaeota archaeon]|nr:ArsR family transcriptional regulator [Candidatus Bathyarchaeota archaeon]